MSLFQGKALPKQDWHLKEKIYIELVLDVIILKMDIIQIKDLWIDHNNRLIHWDAPSKIDCEEYKTKLFNILKNKSPESKIEIITSRANDIYNESDVIAFYKENEVECEIINNENTFEPDCAELEVTDYTIVIPLWMLIQHFFFDTRENIVCKGKSKEELMDSLS